MKGFSGIISSTTLKFRNGDFFFFFLCFIRPVRCTKPHLQCFDVPISNKNVLVWIFPRKEKKVGHNRCSCFQSLPTITNMNLNETQIAFGKDVFQQNPPSSRIPKVRFTDEETRGSQKQDQTPVEQEYLTYNCSHPLLACPSRKARGRIAARAVFCPEQQRQMEN